MGHARLPATPLAEGCTRIVGATLLDGTGAGPVPDAEVEVVDGRITYAGPRRPGAAGTGVRVVDAAGGHLMPGFIDLHVHLAMPNDVTPETKQWWFPEEEAFAVADTLRETLEAGVTTARDLSGLTPGFRNAVARGQIVGPRTHLSVSLLSPTGGHADPVAPNGAVPVYARMETTPSFHVVDTADEVLRTVRRLDRIGADVIKVCTTGGLTSVHDHPSELGMPQEHVALIVAEMRRRRHQPVAAHAQSAQGIREAVLGGAATVEHGYGLTDELVELMLARGTVLVPTLSTLNRVLDPARSTPAQLAHRAQLQRDGMAALGRALAAGLTVGLGTDAGIHRQGRNLTELGHLVDAGMTPVQAVRAGTLVGAQVLGLADDLGSVAPGKLADLVLTDVDPLTHVHDLADPARVRAVWQGGRAVKDLDAVARP